MYIIMHPEQAICKSDKCSIRTKAGHDASLKGCDLRSGVEDADDGEGTRLVASNIIMS